MTHKNLLQTLLGSGNVIPIHKPVLRLTRCYHAAALLEQIVFLMPRAADPEGFVYKTRDEWREECVFETEHQFKTAKSRLVELELLQEKTMRVPRGQSYVNLPAYRIDMEHLAVLLGGGEIHRPGPASSEPHVAHQPDPAKFTDSTQWDSPTRPLDSSPTHIEHSTQHSTQTQPSSSSPEIPEGKPQGLKPEEEGFKDFVKRQNLNKGETEQLLALEGFPFCHAAVRFLIPAHVQIFRAALQLKYKARADWETFSDWLIDFQSDVQAHGSLIVEGALQNTQQTPITYRASTFKYYRKVLVTLTGTEPDPADPEPEDDTVKFPLTPAMQLQHITEIEQVQPGITLHRRPDAVLERIPKTLVVSSVDVLRSGDWVVYCQNDTDFRFGEIKRNYGIHCP